MQLNDTIGYVLGEFDDITVNLFYRSPEIYVLYLVLLVSEKIPITGQSDF